MKNNVQKIVSVLVTLGLFFSTTITVFADEGATGSEPTPSITELTVVPSETVVEPTETVVEPTDSAPLQTEAALDPTEMTPDPTEVTPEPTEITPEPTEITPEPTTQVTEQPLLLAAFSGPNLLQSGQSGTTLSGNKTAAGHIKRVWKWSINKSVTPASWNLFNGDSATSQYTVTVTKTGYEDTTYVSGEVCVTNGGSVATQNLTIYDHIQYKVGSGQFTDLSGGSQTITPGELAPGETECYPYKINFTPVAGANYRNVASITITNHSGSLGTPFGPEPKADFSLPATPDEVVNGSINVDDTNGSSWQFGDSGSVSYNKTFTCGSDQGTHNNTATIRETGQNDSASVIVNCYALAATKTAATTFDRTYKWNINKEADQSSLTLALNQSFLVNYSVVVNMTGYIDSNWAATGTITVTNPAPMDAELTQVTDKLTGNIPASVDCPSQEVPAGGSLTCSYTVDLPDGTDRVNTATATQQNYSYDKDGVGTASGTTNYTGSANVVFSSATITKFDQCIDVTDTYMGNLGSVCVTDALPKTFAYSRLVGPYATCGDYKVDNIAAFVTSDTNTTGSSSWTIDVNVPCGGCSLTIGYWKTHAGFGPQADMVTPLLPQYLGTQFLGLPLGKSVVVSSAGTAVQYLGFYGSNNVFAPSNGINKLYAQLLAAKLNGANGADLSSVSSTISAADAFLTQYNSLNWATLSKQNQNKVIGWMSLLDKFNNGLIGPGHCSQ